MWVSILQIDRQFQFSGLQCLLSRTAYWYSCLVYSNRVHFFEAVRFSRSHVQDIVPLHLSTLNIVNEWREVLSYIQRLQPALFHRVSFTSPVYWGSSLVRLLTSLTIRPVFNWKLNNIKCLKSGNAQCVEECDAIQYIVNVKCKCK